MTKSPPWKQFEVAVAAFIGTLDPTAKVVPNAKLPDKHTGERRQRDVWIETKALQHYPICTLVSCKRYKRQIHQGDIDAFHGEFLSSSAQVGVIYSYSSFREGAVKKAAALGICCCRLYQDQPADLPQSLIIRSHYCCHPRIELSLSTNYSEWGISVWNDLFDTKMPDSDDNESTFLSAILAEFRRAELQEIAELKERVPRSAFPRDWRTAIRIDDPSGKLEPLFIIISGKWVFFAGKTEATLLNGSYSIANHEFLGTQTGPIIDTQGITPGPFWERLAEPPTDIGDSRLVAIRYGGHCEDGLRNIVGPKPVQRHEGTDAALTPGRP
jgi:Restriction endonuclease